MRHNYKGRKLGTDYSHTKAMKRSLVSALFLNDRIKTIESRAKEIRGDVDKIITWAKRGDLHSRRLAMAALGNDSALVREIFEKVEQGMFADRNGGYTRITKLGNRKGDNAKMVIMELITESVPKKKKKKAEPKKATEKKAAPVEATEEVSEKADQEVEEKETVEAESPEEAKEENEAASEVEAEEEAASEEAEESAQEEEGQEEASEEEKKEEE